MLRGPQTPGELKQRTERMQPFASLEEVERDLDGLIDRELARRLERRPGQKEVRYTQLLKSEEDPSAVPSNGLADGHAPAAPTLSDEQGLEERVARLEREVAQLQAMLERPAAPADQGAQAR
jgi:hypothetical protein